MASHAALEVLLNCRTGNVRQVGPVKIEDRSVKVPDKPVKPTKVNFDEYLEAALGGLEWTPAQFWASTHYEFCAAINGRAKTQRRGKPIVGEDYEELKRLAQEHKDEAVADALKNNRSIRSPEERKRERRLLGMKMQTRAAA